MKVKARNTSVQAVDRSPVNNHEGLFKTVFCSVVYNYIITAKLSTESERQVYIHT